MESLPSPARELVLVTPEIAQSFKACNTYPGQRPLNEARIAELIRKAKDTRFHTGSIGLASVPCPQKTYLINGQHQCEAVIRSGISVTCLVQRFACENELQVAVLFSQFDEGGIRTAGHISGAFAASIGAGWQKRCASLCSSSLAFLRYGPHYAGKSTKDERAQLLVEFKDSVDFISRVFFHDHPKHWLAKVGVASAAIGCYQRSDSDAEVFFVSVRDGNMLSEKSPAYRLREYLTANTPSTHRIVSNKGRLGGVAFMREQHVKVIHAWNAYRSGTATDLKYYSHSDIPDIR